MGTFNRHAMRFSTINKNISCWSFWQIHVFQPSHPILLEGALVRARVVKILHFSAVKRGGEKEDENEREERGKWIIILVNDGVGREGGVPSAREVAGRQLK